LRFLFALMIVISALALSACGEEEAGLTATTSTPATAESPTLAAPTPTPAQTVVRTATPKATPTTAPTPIVGAVGDTLSNKTAAVTVNSVDLAFVSPNPYSQPDAGKHFIVIDVTIEAIGSGAVSYNPLDFEVADADSYRYTWEGVVGVESDLSYGDLRPGEKVRGRISFQIPDTAKGLQLLYGPAIGQVIGRWNLTRVEAKATPEPTEESAALAMAISGCQEGMRAAMESNFSQYPALEGVRGEILGVMDNLCSRVVTLICEGASDEEITTAVGGACLQVKSLSEQVGLPFSAETAKDAMSRSMLGDRASIAAACSP